MSMKPAFDALSSKVQDKLELQATDFTEVTGGKSWSCSVSGSSGTAEWFSELSPKFLTGVTFSSRTNPYGKGHVEEFMINIWMGPSYDVPNVLLTFGEQSDEKYHVTADYVIRGATPVGSDPQYMEAYFNEDVSKFWDSANDGAAPLAPPKSMDTRLLASPAKISVGDLSLEKATEICDKHIDRFLEWLEAAKQVPARSRGSFNMRDDKLRQFYYKGEVTKSVEDFGSQLGPVVAAVNTGPTAEAYVGGGS